MNIPDRVIEQHERRLIAAWRDLRTALQRATEVYGGVPRDLEWEAKMNAWEQAVLARRPGSNNGGRS